MIELLEGILKTLLRYYICFTGFVLFIGVVFMVIGKIIPGRDFFEKNAHKFFDLAKKLKDIQKLFNGKGKK